MGLERLKDLLAFNQSFVKDKSYETLVTTNVPEKKMVILSCMDTRLTELLPKALNLKNGDIKLVKNAGGVVVHPFGSIVRSILVAVYEFGVEDVLVIGHYGCGMSKLEGQAMIEKAIERGVSPEIIETLKYSGIDVKSWLEGFGSEEEAVLKSVEALRKHPLMPADVRVHGFIMHPDTGQMDTLVLSDTSVE